MAIDKDGPSVAGDIYTKKVSVVESFAKPVPAFTLSPENGSSDTYQFNASGSYDPTDTYDTIAGISTGTASSTKKYTGSITPRIPIQRTATTP